MSDQNIENTDPILGSDPSEAEPVESSSPGPDPNRIRVSGEPGPQTNTEGSVTEGSVTEDEAEG